MRGRPARLAALVVLATACVPRATRDRAWLDREVARRTGHGIGAGDPAVESMPPGVQLGDGLAEDEAVAVALWRNADYQADLARLGLARADLIAAGLPANPTLLTIGPQSVEADLVWALGWLFQRPRKVKAARLEMERLAEELVQHGLDLERDVRLAHADWVLAERRVTIATETAASWTEIAGLTEKRWRAGDIGRAELDGARAQAGSAATDVTAQENTRAEAKARMAELLGLDVGGVGIDPGGEVPPPAAVEPLVERARKHRPDRRAARLAVEAAAARLGLAKLKAYDILAGLEAKYTYPPSVLDPGIDLNLPLFDRGQADKARASAELQAASWHYVATGRTIDREVRTAHAKLEEALAVLASWRTDVLKPAEDAVGFARSQFDAGDESYLVVLDANRRRDEARLREAQLEDEARRARAELQRAVGGGP